MDAATQVFTLRYRSQRGELWKFYWRRWRTGLWRQWLLAIVAVASAMSYGQQQNHPGQWPTIGDIAMTLLAVSAVLAIFVIYPQVMFKSQKRTLVVDPNGIDTAIGSQSGHRSWRDIGVVIDNGDTIMLVVARTGNAFVVPARAFRDDSERAAFLRAANTWHRAAHSA